MTNDALTTTTYVVHVTYDNHDRGTFRDYDHFEAAVQDAERLAKLPAARTVRVEKIESSDVWAWGR